MRCNTSSSNDPLLNKKTKHVTLVSHENLYNMWECCTHASLVFDAGGPVVCLLHKIAQWQYVFPNEASLFLLYSAVTPKLWALDNAIEYNCCSLNREPVGFRQQENTAWLLLSAMYVKWQQESWTPQHTRAHAHARTHPLILLPSPTIEKPVYLCVQLRVWNLTMVN